VDSSRLDRDRDGPAAVPVSGTASKSAGPRGKEVAWKRWAERNDSKPCQLTWVLT